MKRTDLQNVVAPGGPGVPPVAVVRDVKNPTRVGGDPTAAPFVDPRVTDPAALRYAVNAQSRRRGAALPRYTEPVAGGPDVPIPRLDSEAFTGVTMAQQAQRGMPAPDAVRQVIQSMGGEPALGGGIVEGTTHQQAPMPQPRMGGLVAPEGLLPTDMLPDQATRDPAFRQGQGAMFAVHQPELAYKYGVMRGQQFVQPHQLKSGKTQQQGGLRPETVAGLQALEELNKQRDATTERAADAAIEEEARKGPSQGGEVSTKLTDEERSTILDGMDEFDKGRLKNATYKDMLNNEEQRALIEKRLSPLDLTELIVTGRVRQVVPVLPGVFEPEFQSYDGDDDLTIKRLVGEETVGLMLPDRYILDKYQLMGLTIALRAINKKVFPDYRDAEGKFDTAAFWKKYAVVSRFNYHMIASLMVHWFWFDVRVRQLFKAQALGNG